MDDAPSCSVSSLRIALTDLTRSPTRIAAGQKLTFETRPEMVDEFFRDACVRSDDDRRYLRDLHDDHQLSRSELDSLQRAFEARLRKLGDLRARLHAMTAGWYGKYGTSKPPSTAPFLRQHGLEGQDDGYLLWHREYETYIWAFFADLLAESAVSSRWQKGWRLKRGGTPEDARDAYQAFQGLLLKELCCRWTPGEMTFFDFARYRYLLFRETKKPSPTPISQFPHDPVPDAEALHDDLDHGDPLYLQLLPPRDQQLIRLNIEHGRDDYVRFVRLTYPKMNDGAVATALCRARGKLRMLDSIDACASAILHDRLDARALAIQLASLDREAGPDSRDNPARILVNRFFDLLRGQAIADRPPLFLPARGARMREWLRKPAAVAFAHEALDLLPDTRSDGDRLLDFGEAMIALMKDMKSPAGVDASRHDASLAGALDGLTAPTRVEVLRRGWRQWPHALGSSLPHVVAAAMLRGWTSLVELSVHDKDPLKQVKHARRELATALFTTLERRIGPSQRPT